MDHANTGKVQAPFLYIRVGSFFDERGVCECVCRGVGGGGVGGKDVYSVCPVVASIQLVMSSGVVRPVN